MAALAEGIFKDALRSAEGLADDVRDGDLIELLLAVEAMTKRAVELDGVKNARNLAHGADASGDASQV